MFPRSLLLESTSKMAADEAGHSGEHRASTSRSAIYITEDGSSDDEIPSPLTFASSKSVGHRGEPFCDCFRQGRDSECRCGEDDTEFEWFWDGDSKSSAAVLCPDRREVKFHTDYSCGTAAIRGTQPLKEDQYYWEIKMVTPVYGTDMMVGVGTSHIAMDRFRHTFCSFLGKDSESWGLSYTGLTYHKGVSKKFSGRFTQGSIIGVHLDMWRGTLTYYKNRKLLGTAYAGLNGRTLYPMVSSTAARSGMKIICCRSFKSSLQFLCCQTLRNATPASLNVADVLKLPPGLRGFMINNLNWLMRPCVKERPPRGAGGQKRRWTIPPSIYPEQSTEDSEPERKRKAL